MTKWKPGDTEPTYHDADGGEIPYNPGAVEAWAARGVFPPPLAGDPGNPEHVTNTKRARANHARLEAEGKLRPPPTDEDAKEALEANPDMSFGEMLELLFRDSGLFVSYSEDGRPRTFPADEGFEKS
jgi:hypothetical protein